MFGEKVEIAEKYYFDIQRRVVSHKTLEAWETIPHVSFSIDLDVGNVFDFVRAIASDQEFDGLKLSFNTVILKIVAEGLKKSPEMNAHIYYDTTTSIGEMRLMKDINIAIPMITDSHRMLTPVLMHVDRLSLREMCVEMETLRRRANNTNIELLMYEAALRDTRHKLLRGNLMVLWRLYKNLVSKAKIALPSRKAKREYAKIPATERLVADDLLNGTVICSNVGSVMPKLKAQVAMLMVIAPQTTAFCIPAARKQPVIVQEDGKDTIAIRQILPLTICFDHRAMDFEHVTGFISRVLELCDNPWELHPGHAQAARRPETDAVSS